MDKENIMLGGDIMGIAKWRKIDFHTHTPESRCFKNRENVTPEEWIVAVKNSGLDAVVVTDHNSVGWIDKLRKTLKDDDNLFLFPGVELCVGTSFTHILIIFDPKMKTEDIEGFMVQCGILKSDWGDTTQCVEEKVLADLIIKYRERILVIPAHFNEEKGICRTLKQNGIKEFFQKINFDAIEVRNKNDIDEVNNKIRNKAIPKLAVITGSDNPDSEKRGHDLINFGKAYTWIKISEFSLEALRQVFLDFETRSYCMLSSTNQSNDLNNIQHNYISGIKIKNLKHIDDLNFRLSPNLNCIIGGRGSGKSTIIEMIRLGLKQYDSKNLNTIINNTYKDETCIDLFYNFGSENRYCIHINGKKNNKQWNVEDENGITEDYPKFPISIYSQKELYNLVEDEKNPEHNENSPLIRIIDDNINYEKMQVNDKVATTRKEIITLAEALNVISNQMKEIPMLRSDIELNKGKLAKLKDTGIIEKRNELLMIRNSYNTVNEILKDNFNLLDDIENLCRNKIESVINRCKEERLAEKNYEKNYNNVIYNIIEMNQNLFKNIIESKDILEKQKNIIETSELKIDMDKNQNDFNKILETIENINIDDYKKIENDISEQEMRLRKLKQLELEANSYKEKIREKIKLYIEAYEELSDLRQNVIEDINQSATNIKLKINPLSNSDKWLYNMRNELGKFNVFDLDFEKIKRKVFKSNVVKKDELLNWLEFLLLSESGDIKEVIGNNIDHRFEKLFIDKKKDNTLHTLINFIPEDKVEIKILNKGNKISINEGSPGQKSAAILAFILNQGKNPLIIDQPEDDLDNSLIINLIVESIRNIKNSRQIIIVTHNPNIPVLGDAEGIIMLDRNDKGKVTLKNGKKAGCIEEKTIKEGICEIMEGGIDSFKLRENKYKYLQK